jgi:hypothetical protein
MLCWAALEYALCYALEYALCYALEYALCYALGYVLYCALGYALCYALGYVLYCALGYVLYCALGYALCYALEYAGLGWAGLCNGMQEGRGRWLFPRKAVSAAPRNSSLIKGMGMITYTTCTHIRINKQHNISTLSYLIKISPLV